jgi:hypothetical protein
MVVDPSMADLFGILTSLEAQLVFFEDGRDFSYCLNHILFPRGGLYHFGYFCERLVAVQWKLTHLRSAMSLEVAHFEPLDFSRLHFPNLESLDIEKMTFCSAPAPLPVG